MAYIYSLMDHGYFVVFSEPVTRRHSHRSHLDRMDDWLQHHQHENKSDMSYYEVE